MNENTIQVMTKDGVYTLENSSLCVVQDSFDLKSSDWKFEAFPRVAGRIIVGEYFVDFGRMVEHDEE